MPNLKFPRDPRQCSESHFAVSCDSTFYRTSAVVTATPTEEETMSSTSQKRRNFVSEPMGNKHVTTLPGIGEALGEKLEGKGYDKASKLLGEFLVQKKDKTLFTETLQKNCGANRKQASDCYNALKDWSDSFL
ncbi:hypothetical protein HPB47_001184 [Ixodes persulcatus]|uniref:Uncharacterized protein n=1 Tax=Ixodes persulcatus TaxID=34615 RepID=A0AC60PR78_IXOPE|nr:hypothetical protein HPB47_001184 [Ixodes persulcatus]